MKIELTKELYDDLKKAVAGLPSQKMVAVQVNAMRAMLRKIDRGTLPNEESEDEESDTEIADAAV